MRPLVLLALLAACADPGEKRRPELEALAARHDLELARFHEVQAGFRRSNTFPRELDLGADGSIRVEHCDLRGGPGREEFWCKYTWTNTTGRAIDEARVTLTLLDPASGWSHTERMDLRRPLRFPFGPDSSYTTHFLVPLRGRTLLALEWSLAAEAVADPEDG